MSGDTRGTLPLRPEPMYDPSAARPRHDEPIPTDAPPKYAQISVPTATDVTAR